MNSKKNKSLSTFLLTGIIAMVVIIIIILIIGSFAGKKLSYSSFENKVNKIALEFAKDRVDYLPAEGEEKEISYQQLVDAKKIKPINSILKNGENCEVSIKIKNNNNQYIALTYLNCGENYTTVTIKDKILSNNNIVSSSHGLYKINDEYVFRGEKVNNYITFNDKTWRIIKITSSGDLRLIETTRKDSYVWDNRYNIDKNSNTGINDYRVSRIKDTLEYIYKNEFANVKGYIASQDICLGKRDSQGTKNTGEVECRDILYKQYISLPQANEFVIASIDNNCNSLTSVSCSNYNYMIYFGQNIWTITGDTASSDKVFRMASTVSSSYASTSGAMRVVLHLDGDAIYVSGKGTSSSPYVIKTA